MARVVIIIQDTSYDGGADISVHTTAAIEETSRSVAERFRDIALRGIETDDDYVTEERALTAIGPE